MPPTRNSSHCNPNDPKQPAARQREHVQEEGQSAAIQLPASPRFTTIEGDFIGVRGIIKTVSNGGPERDPALFAAEVGQFSARMKTGGVHLVHALFDTSPSYPEKALWQSLGYKSQNALMFVRLLGSDEPLAPISAPKPNLSIGPATNQELARFTPQLSEDPRLGFRPWENDLLRAPETTHNLSATALRRAGKCIGVSIGGRSGFHATFTHVYVDPAQRDYGIGSWFVDTMVADLRRAGVSTVYVMVANDSQPIRKFWSSRQFWQMPQDSYMLLDTAAKP